MREYIRISDFIKDILKVESYYLNEYFQFINYQIIGNKISMDLLREYYKKCKINGEIEKFNRTTNEMVMRGFEFISDKNLGILPDFKLPLKVNILIPEVAENNFKKIDFNSFDLNDFINQYKIYSDNFFLEFPLEGLLYLNSNINIINIEEKFKDNGFNIVNIDNQIEEANNKIEEIQNNDIESKQEYKPEIVINDKVLLLNRKIKVKKYFETISELHFLRFCSENEIENTSDITEEILEKYKLYEGTGEKKYENIVQKLSKVEEFLLQNSAEDFLDSEEEYDTDIVMDNKLGLINRKIKVKKYFEGTSYLHFLKFCDENHIYSIGEITKKVLNSYRLYKGTGDKKYESIVQKLSKIDEFLLNSPLDESGEFSSYYNDEVNELEVFLDEENLIDTIFLERKFEMFREYSSQKGLKYIYDITPEILLDFRIQPQIGNGKYELVKEKYEEEIKKIASEEIENKKIERLGKIELLSDYAKELRVTEVIKVYRQVEELENLKLISLEGKEYKELLQLNLLSQTEILELSKVLEKLIPLDEIFNNLELEEEEIKLLTERIVDKKTLEALGCEMEVTRERVRQKEVKALKKLENYLNINSLKEVFDYIFKNKKYVTIDEFKEKLSDKNKIYIEFFKNLNIVNYSEELEVFSIEDINIEELKKELSELPDIFNMYDELEKIYNILKGYGLEELPIENYEKLFYVLKYKKYKNYYIKGGFSYRKILPIIFKEYIDDSLRIDEIGAEKLKKIALREFGSGLGENERSIEACIMDCEEILLIGPKTYKHYSKIKYNEDLINEAEKIFEECIRMGNEYISIEEIMHKFKEEKIISGNETKHLIYSLLKYNLEEQYNFGNRNALQINFTDRKLSREEQVINFINSNGGSIEKKRILEELQWKEYKLDITISKSPKLLVIENGFVLSIDNIILTVENIEKIQSYIDEKMKGKEYLSINNLYRDMKFNHELYNVLKKNSINSGTILYFLLKKKNIVKNYKFSDRGLFILSLDSKIKNICDIIQLEFSDGIYNRESISDFYKKQGYQTAMISTAPDRLLEQGIISLISKDKFMLSKNINLENSLIEKLIEIVESELLKNEFIVLDTINFGKELERVREFGKWNPYLVKTILELNSKEYRFINRDNRDYRYDKIILVRSSSELYSQEDLIYKLLKTDYKGNLHEIKVYDYLVEKNIYSPKEKDYEKKLYYGVKNFLEGKIEIDERGIITLK